MNKDKIKEKVLQMVSEKIDIPLENLKLENLFIQDLGFDSLGVLDLILAVEEHFQMTIPDEDAENIKTIGDAVEYISKNLK